MAEFVKVEIKANFNLDNDPYHLYFRFWSWVRICSPRAFRFAKALSQPSTVHGKNITGLSTY